MQSMLILSTLSTWPLEEVFLQEGGRSDTLQSPINKVHGSNSFLYSCEKQSTLPPKYSSRLVSSPDPPSTSSGKNRKEKEKGGSGKCAYTSTHSRGLESQQKYIVTPAHTAEPHTCMLSAGTLTEEESQPHCHICMLSAGRLPALTEEESQPHCHTYMLSAGYIYRHTQQRNHNHTHACSVLVAQVEFQVAIRYAWEYCYRAEFTYRNKVQYS